MQNYQQQLIELAMRYQALRFGTFKLKSGRISPYFFNAGNFNDGEALAKLSVCYAEAIEAANIEYDMLFGPAYKGIPLVAGTAMALANHCSKNIPFAFNRKEVKDHGEGGNIIGAELNGKILIVDDVITAGTATRESISIIEQAGAKAKGIVIALDRQERGQNQQSALQEIEGKYGLQVISIIKLEQLIEYVKQNDEVKEYLPSMLTYRDEYGVN